MNIVDLILQASPVVQGVMSLLMLMSVYVWLLIFSKIVAVNKTYKQSRFFHRRFSGSNNLLTLYQELLQKKQVAPEKLGYLEAIFVTGFTAYSEQSAVSTAHISTASDIIRRTMQQEFNTRMDALEDRAPMLATIGSSAPYIGLFGTVWGIISSFQALGAVKHATLALVAPGISEALIATAMGLFVAIPAVIGYNRFNTASERLASEFEGFVDEFMRLIEKQFITSAPGSVST